MDQELDRFKQIDLRTYAASQGYALDRHDKSAMRHENGDKIIVSRKSCLDIMTMVNGGSLSSRLINAHFPNWLTALRVRRRT